MAEIGGELLKGSTFIGGGTIELLHGHIKIGTALEIGQFGENPARS